MIRFVCGVKMKVGRCVSYIADYNVLDRGLVLYGNVDWAWLPNWELAFEDGGHRFVSCSDDRTLVIWSNDENSKDVHQDGR